MRTELNDWKNEDRQLPHGWLDGATDVRLLGADAAAQAWDAHTGPWLSDPATWHDRGAWKAGGVLPVLLARLSWGPEERVIFFVSREHVLEASWASFREHWDEFLALHAAGGVLTCHGHLEVVQFDAAGAVLLGARPH